MKFRNKFIFQKKKKKKNLNLLFCYVFVLNLDQDLQFIFRNFLANSARFIS